MKVSTMFRTSVFLAASTAVLLSLLPSIAIAELVIDFQSLEHVDGATGDHGLLYSEDGYTLTVDGSLGFVTFGTLEFRYTGSTAMAMRQSPSLTTLTQDAGGAFGVTSIDLAELNGPNSAVIAFTGTLSGGGTTEQSFTLDGVAFGAETFLFNSTFENITSLSWSQGSSFHQFDNIQISAVPEPSSLLMVGIGMATLACRRRRTPVGT